MEMTAPEEEVSSGEEGCLTSVFLFHFLLTAKQQSPWREVKQHFQKIREWTFVHTQLHLSGCPYTTTKPELNSFIGAGEWL